MDSKKTTCRVTNRIVVITRDRVGDASGIGDESSQPQFDWQCSLEDVCSRAGTKACPVARANSEPPYK